MTPGTPRRPGSKLGPYEVLSPLAERSGGSVYAARDTRSGRTVAVTWLPALAGDSEAVERLQREARAVTALSHPGIVPTLDFGVEDGVPYVVTEAWDGETLRKRLDSGPLSPARAADHALNLAQALGAAHAAGIVHRNLTPEGILVTPDGRARILDFGVASRTGETDPVEQTNVPTPSVPSLPESLDYQSPEQVRDLPADPRSDIFAFGAVLYEMLSGKQPFRKENPADTMVSILREDPPELPTNGGRPVPAALDRIVRHCLEKEPAERFQSARDIAFDLRHLADDTASALPSAPPSPSRFRGRLVAVLVACALSAAVGAGLFLRGRPAEKRRIAVLPFENLGAPEDRYVVDGIADEIRGKLASVAGLEVIGRMSSAPYAKGGTAPRKIAEDLGVSYLLTAKVRWEKPAGAPSRIRVSPELVEVKGAGAPTARWQQTFEEELTGVLRVQSEIATRVAESLGVALGSQDARRVGESPTESIRAYQAYLRGVEAAGPNDPVGMRKAYGLYEEALALDPDFSAAWAAKSFAATRLFMWSTPMPDLSRRAVEAAQRAVRLSPERPWGHAALAFHARLVQRDSARAFVHASEAYRLAPGDATVVSALVAAEMASGRWQDALEHARRAERLDPRSVASSLSFLFLRLRRPEEARAICDRGLAQEPRNLHFVHRKMETYLQQGDLPGARAIGRSALKEVSPVTYVAYIANASDIFVLDAEQLTVLVGLTPAAFNNGKGRWAISLTQAHALRNDRAAARVHAEIAVQAFSEELRTKADQATPHALLGLALAYAGRKTEALREGERAVELAPVSQQAEIGPAYLHNLARIRILVGEHEKALDTLETLLRIPYFLTPGWLRIDPDFSPLRGNPRFERLAAVPR